MILGTGKIIKTVISSPKPSDRLWAHPAFYSVSTSFFFPVGLSGWGVKLTTRQCNAGIRNERNYTTTLCVE